MDQPNLIARAKTELLQAPARLWFTLRLSSIVVATLALIYEIGSRAFSSTTLLLLQPWNSYDAEYYIRIVKNGYQHGDITSGFHPLYPWSAYALSLLIQNPLLSLMLVSSAAGLLLTLAFYRLALVDANHDQAWTATALFLCWPVTVAIFAPYTEALFLLMAVCCLFAARKKHYWISGIFGGLAALTRQHGIFLALPLAWELWEFSNREWRRALRHWYKWLAVGLVPCGYGLWILYRAFAISDVKPDFSSPQRFIYSVMVSPTAYEIYKDQQFVAPWVAVWKAATVLWRGGVHWSAYGDVFLGILFILMFVFAWRYIRTSYRLYSLVVILAALSLNTGTGINPYISLPRHMLPALPVFIGVALGYKFQRLNFVLVVLAICQSLFLCCFVWQTWVL